MSKKDKDLRSAYLLPSGRAVQVRELGPSERHRVQDNAAKVAGRDALPAVLGAQESREGVFAMICAVSVRDDITDVQDLVKPDMQWSKCDASRLHEEYDDLFSSRDDTLLQGIYERTHYVQRDAVEAISGKALKVSSV